MFEDTSIDMTGLLEAHEQKRWMHCESSRIHVEPSINNHRGDRNN